MLRLVWLRYYLLQMVPWQLRSLRVSKRSLRELRSWFKDYRSGKDTLTAWLREPNPSTSHHRNACYVADLRVSLYCEHQKYKAFLRKLREDDRA